MPGDWKIDARVRHGVIMQVESTGCSQWSRNAAAGNKRKETLPRYFYGTSSGLACMLTPRGKLIPHSTPYTDRSTGSGSIN
jgi:hypothetical protein